MSDREEWVPSAAQCADWWLSGQLLAKPEDLLKSLVEEHNELLRENKRLRELLRHASEAKVEPESKVDREDPPVGGA